LRREIIDEYLGSAIEDVEIVSWDTRSAAVLAQRERRLGALRLEVAPLRTPPDDAIVREMLRGIRELGLTALPWTRDLRQWCARVDTLRTVEPDVTPAWPDVSEAALLDSLDTWLAPWLERVSRREHLQRIDLRAALHGLLQGRQPARLETLAPTHYAVPSGSRIAIDYTGGNPTIAVRPAGGVRIAAVADDRGRSSRADPAVTVAGAASGPGDARSRELLAQWLCGGAQGAQGPLSKALLARGSAAGHRDTPRAAGMSTP
jgi:HrpA-like RNA helicase